MRRPETLELLHFNGTDWETISTPAGRHATTITGTITSFSEFAVAESADACAAAQPVVETPASSAWSLWLACLAAVAGVVIARRRPLSGT